MQIDAVPCKYVTSNALLRTKGALWPSNMAKPQMGAGTLNRSQQLKDWGEHSVKTYLCSVHVHYIRRILYLVSTSVIHILYLSIYIYINIFLYLYIYIY